CRKTSSSCIRPAAASRCTATRCSSPPAKPSSSRSTRRPAAKCGRRRSRTTRTAITCRWRRWSPTARSSSARPAASSASVDLSPRLLVDYTRGGRTVKGLIDVARDGYLWFLERGADGPIKFVQGMPYVKQNVFRSLDPQTGRPDVDPAHKPGTGKKADHCPSL